VAVLQQIGSTGEHRLHLAQGLEVAFQLTHRFRAAGQVAQRFQLFLCRLGIAERDVLRGLGGETITRFVQALQCAAAVRFELDGLPVQRGGAVVADEMTALQGFVRAFEQATHLRRVHAALLGQGLRVLARAPCDDRTRRERERRSGETLAVHDRRHHRRRRHRHRSRHRLARCGHAIRLDVEHAREEVIDQGRAEHEHAERAAEGALALNGLVARHVGRPARACYGASLTIFHRP
jgi:hypothetical protein